MATHDMWPSMTTMTTSPSIIDDGICASAIWNKNGTTVAGGNEYGSELNQLDHPYGIFVDDHANVYIADAYNSRIVKWAFGVSTGEVVVGWNGTGDRSDEIDYATSVVFDKNGTMFICDNAKSRVKRWFKGDDYGQIIIANISCFGLVLDNEGSLYVTDRYQVIKWPSGEVVAGNNKEGGALNQLAYPFHLFVDQDQSVFVPDASNYRVVKWIVGAKEGMVVAGGNGLGDEANQTNWPTSAITDKMGTVYVAEWGNHRITRWFKDSKSGIVILGGDRGKEAYQLAFPTSLAFDRQGNLYVADLGYNRIQMFTIDKRSCHAVPPSS
ncbi:unnamed protein product [Rotaria magnacalcarata]|nr:unnamed protein product [Rotaria magnacalcarata]CAF4145606.1 unnamed protein product [Rotaria magnacalcarata]